MKLRAPTLTRARLLGVASALALLALTAAALARPGGGSSYSGGSSGSSGGGSSGGGSSGGSSGDGGAIVELLIWLCIEHPAVGIPLTLVAVVGFLVVKSQQKKTGDWSAGAARPHVHVHHAPAPVAAPPPRAPVDLEVLRAADPTFSRVVFEDFLYSLYAEVQRARGLPTPPPQPGRQPAPPLTMLSAYLAPDVIQALLAATRGPVEGVIVGALHVLSASATPQGARVEVELEANYSEAGVGYYVRERWALFRGPSAKSREPSRVRVLGCPSCGAAQEAVFAGTCRHCGQTVNNGAFDWIVQSARVLEREPRGPILTSNVAERGTNLPTRVDRQRDQAMAALREKDPAFDPQAFQQRVGLIFQQFQIAWSARNLAQMRPFLSDTLFSTQQYWVQAYLAQRLRNITEGARITGLEIVKLTSDRYFDAITVRLWAESLDYTVSDDGRLVSGSKTIARAYSEYWTLIRGTNRKGPTRTDLACSNCGGALNVNMAGTCTFCNVKVTTGDFDWVLSRIEQDESSGG